MKLKRSDNQYIEMEEFADYELTQCIAYEMAIRNWRHKDLADGVVNYYNHYKEDIDYFLKNRNLSKEDINFDKFIKTQEAYNELVSLMLEIEVFEVNYTFPLYEEPIYKDPRLGNEFWEIVSLCRINIDEDKTILEQKGSTLIHQKDLQEIQLFKTIHRDGYSIETTLKTDDEDCLIPIDPADEYSESKLVENIQEYANFIKKDGYWSYPKILIEEHFKRPKIQTDKLKTLDTELTINLNKPLDEIIAFITHVKNDIDENKLLKLPIELLGVQLSRADNIVCNAKGEKCFDPRKILSTQQKMADMFFIYDCLKIGYSQTKIRNSVYNYYADKGIENITLDPATLRKYKDIAFEYIVYSRYKELLTGISMEALLKYECEF